MQTQSVQNASFRIAPIDGFVLENCQTNFDMYSKPDIQYDIIVVRNIGYF